MARTTARPDARPAAGIGSASHRDSSAPLIRIEDLQVQYLGPRGPVRAVDGVTFDIRPGEVLGLAGESGSGKSTIAQAILRILQPPAVITGGRVMFGDEDILDMSDEALGEFRWRDVSMVFQSAMNSLNPVMTVGDQIVDAIQAHQPMPARKARARAEELLKIVGIEAARIEAYPHQLSGGMRQRAVIAIALALNPPLMIMDEPTTALDVVVQKDIMHTISMLKQELGFSILFITHDLSLLVEISDRIAIMYAGQIIELADARELFDEPMHPYTQGLMSSFPSLTGPRARLTGIAGSPPDQVNPPAGCRFKARCSHRFAPCDIVPLFAEAKPNHLVACHLYPESRTSEAQEAIS